MVLYPRFVVGILTVPFTAYEIQVFPVLAAISNYRSLLESPRYTSCEFAMVECRRFAVGILMTYVIVSEIFSTRCSVGHDCWTFRCYVHSHKPLFCFWKDVYLYHYQKG